MHSAYFEARFLVNNLPSRWPDQFAIISAFATTGEQWSPADNDEADVRLKRRLEQVASWMHRIVGYSPTTGHSEPSWAVALDWDQACDLGEEFLQDAIYFVTKDRLCVTHCDDRRQPVEVGVFSQRLDVSAEPLGLGFSRRGDRSSQERP